MSHAFKHQLQLFEFLFFRFPRPQGHVPGLPLVLASAQQPRYQMQRAHMQSNNGYYLSDFVAGQSQFYQHVPPPAVQQPHPSYAVPPEYVYDPTFYTETLAVKKKKSEKKKRKHKTKKKKKRRETSSSSTSSTSSEDSSESESETDQPRRKQKLKKKKKRKKKRKKVVTDTESSDSDSDSQDSQVPVPRKKPRKSQPIVVPETKKKKKTSDGTVTHRAIPKEQVARTPASATAASSVVVGATLEIVSSDNVSSPDIHESSSVVVQAQDTSFSAPDPVIEEKADEKADDEYVYLKVRKDEVGAQSVESCVMEIGSKLSEEDLLKANISDLTLEERQKRKILKHRIAQKDYKEKKLKEEGDAYLAECRERTRKSRELKRLAEGTPKRPRGRPPVIKTEEVEIDTDVLDETGVSEISTPCGSDKSSVKKSSEFGLVQDTPRGRGRGARKRALDLSETDSQEKTPRGRRSVRKSTPASSSKKSVTDVSESSSKKTVTDVDADEALET